MGIMIVREDPGRNKNAGKNARKVM
jgi:hypothetical protein